MAREVEIIDDCNGKKLVKINAIQFSGKRNMDWKEVKEYLKAYVGESYKVSDAEDMVCIGNDLPDEYTGWICLTLMTSIILAEKKIWRSEFTESMIK